MIRAVSTIAMFIILGCGGPPDEEPTAAAHVDGGGVHACSIDVDAPADARSALLMYRPRATPILLLGSNGKVFRWARTSKGIPFYAVPGETVHDSNKVVRELARLRATLPACTGESAALGITAAFSEGPSWGAIHWWKLDSQGSPVLLPIHDPTRPEVLTSLVDLTDSLGESEAAGKIEILAARSPREDGGCPPWPPDVTPPVMSSDNVRILLPLQDVAKLKNVQGCLQLDEAYLRIRVRPTGPLDKDLKSYLPPMHMDL